MRRLPLLLLSIVAASAVGTAAAASREGCSDPVGRWPYGPCQVVATGPSIAVVGEGTVLGVVDVSDPDSPVRTGEVVLDEVVRGAAVGDGWAYLANGRGGFKVVHLGDPANPSVSASLDLWPDREESLLDVALKGSICYVVDDGGRLSLVDVSDPEHPFLRGWEEVPGARRLTLWSQFALVVGSEGLAMVIVTNPDAPYIRGTWTGALTDPDVAAVGETAFVTQSGLLRIFTLQDPLNPALQSMIFLPNAVSVAATEGFALVAAGPRGLWVVDARDPYAPELYSGADSAGQSAEVLLAGDRVYLADGGGGLRLFDLGDLPFLGLERGSVPTAGSLRDIEVGGSLAYLADADRGLVVLDLQAQGGPTEVGRSRPVRSAEAVALFEGPASRPFAAMALSGASRGLSLFDLTVPGAPVEVGSLATPNDCTSVQVAWPYAYVGTYGLTVVDITDPSNPEELGSVLGPSFVRGLAVADGFAYGATGLKGLRVFSVSDPAAPVEVASATTPENARSIAREGAYLYLADQGATGLHIFRLDAPGQAVEVAAVGSSPANDLCLSGTRLFLGGAQGVQAWNIGFPEAPSALGSVKTPGSPAAVSPWGIGVAVADQEAGVTLFLDPASCLPGDCDGDGQVSIGEVQKAINMFLGLLDPACGVDANGSGEVSIGEVQKVINAFLGVGR